MVAMRSYIYDKEDDEVIDHDSWSDAWQKNDERSGEKDVIDTVVDKMKTNDPLFKQEAHALLSKYKDLFSLTLSVEPALLPPLRIEIDKAKFETRRAQGPYRLMSVGKDKHMAKFIAVSYTHLTLPTIYSV